MKYFLIFPCLWMAFSLPAAAELPVAELKRDKPVNFATEIYPFLKTNCLACHNSTKAKADLILESPQDMIRGGDTGPAVEPGNANHSFLFTTAAHLEEPTMPPANNKSKAKNLTPEQLALLRRWIDEGARGDVVSTEAPKSWTRLTGPQPIYTAALSPDGRFAVAGRGQEIDVYDLRLGRREASFVDPELEHATAHRDFVQAIAISPDGLVASGGYRTVKVWSRSEARPGEALPLPDVPSAIAVSPDQKHTAIGTKNGTVLLLARKDLNLSAITVKDHGGEVTDLVFSADGKTLFSSSVDKTVRRRAVDQPGTSSALSLPSPVSGIALLGGGKLLAAAGTDEVVRIAYADLKTPLKSAMPAPAPAPAPVAKAEAAKGKPAPKPAPPVQPKPAQPTPAVKWAEWKPHPQPVIALKTVDDAGTEVLAGFKDGTVSLHKFDPAQPVAPPKEIRRIAHGGELLTLEVAGPSGNAFFVTAGATGPAKLWNPADGKLLFELQGDPRIAPRIDGLARESTIAKRLKAYWDKKVPEEEKLWKAESEKSKTAGAAIAGARRALEAGKTALGQLENKFPAATAEEISKASEAVAAAERTLAGAIRNRDSAARLAGDAFARHTGALSAALEAESIVTALQSEGEALKKAEAEAVAKSSRRGVSVTPDGAILVEALSGGALRLWSTKSGEWLEDLPAAPEASQLIATGSHQLLLTTADRTAQLWTLPGESWNLRKSIGNGADPDPFVDRVSALAFTPNGEGLLVGTGVPSRSGAISLWDTESWSRLRENKKAHDDTITSFAFSPDGSRFASGGTDQLVRIFETDTLTGQKTFEGHTSHVLDVSWNQDDLTLASSSADLQVKVWDLAEGREKSKVEGFQKEVSAVAFLGASDSLVTASGDKTLKLSNEPLPGAGVTFLHTADVSQDGKTIIAGGQDSVLRVWDARAKKLVNSFSPPENAGNKTLASE